jgi:hypothetical protein
MNGILMTWFRYAIIVTAFYIRPDNADPLDVAYNLGL